VGFGEINWLQLLPLRTTAGYRGARPRTAAAVLGLRHIHFSTHYKKVLEIIQTTLTIIDQSRCRERRQPAGR